MHKIYVKKNYVTVFFQTFLQPDGKPVGGEGVEIARERGGEGRGIADDSQHSAPLHPHWDPDVTTAADRKRSEVGEGGGGGEGAAGVGNQLYFAVGIVLLLCQ